MDLMAKIKQSEQEPSEPAPITFRPASQVLIDVIAETARSERRSRNLMIQILLEEALAARGMWPPSQSPDE